MSEIISYVRSTSEIFKKNFILVLFIVVATIGKLVLHTYSYVAIVLVQSCD